jgi:hypothetical protein
MLASPRKKVWIRSFGCIINPCDAERRRRDRPNVVVYGVVGMVLANLPNLESESIIDRREEKLKRASVLIS